MKLGENSKNWANVMKLDDRNMSEKINSVNSFRFKYFMNYFLLLLKLENLCEVLRKIEKALQDTK